MYPGNGQIYQARLGWASRPTCVQQPIQVLSHFSHTTPQAIRPAESRCTVFLCKTAAARLFDNSGRIVHQHNEDLHFSMHHRPRPPGAGSADLSNQPLTIPSQSFPIPHQARTHPCFIRRTSMANPVRPATSEIGVP